MIFIHSKKTCIEYNVVHQNSFVWNQFIKLFMHFNYCRTFWGKKLVEIDLYEIVHLLNNCLFCLVVIVFDNQLFILMNNYIICGRVGGPHFTASMTMWHGVARVSWGSREILIWTSYATEGFMRFSWDPHFILQ